MSRFLSILLFVAVAFVGCRIYRYWDKVQSGQFQKEEAAAQEVVPELLAGLPSVLDESLREAEKGGSASLGKWLNAHGWEVQDPRLAWIQLDYCSDLLLSNPSEAKRIFEAVKVRTPTNSPVFRRIRRVEKSFE